MRNGWLVLLVLVCVMACSTLPLNPSRDPGRDAAEQAVRAYIDALNASDPARVTAAIGPHRVDAAKLIEVLGGRDWQGVRIVLSSEFERVYSVVIDAHDGLGAKHSWRETIEWNGTSWDFAPLSPPANPTRM